MSEITNIIQSNLLTERVLFCDDFIMIWLAFWFVVVWGRVKMVVYSISIPICSWKYVGNVCDRSNKEIVEISNLPNVESLKGMWHSGSASALHAESPGFNSPHLQQYSNGHVFDSRWVLHRHL